MPPDSVSTRVRISSAALFVNVTARISSLLRVSLGKQVRDTLRDDARLAGAGAGKDEQRSVDVQNGVALFGIETL